MRLPDDFCKADAAGDEAGNLKQSLRGGHAERFGPQIAIDLAAKAFHADIQRADALLQRFGKGPADRHDFADRLHLRTQHWIGAGEFLEVPARNLDDNIIQRGFKAGGRFQGDIVGNLIQRETDGDQRGDLCDGEAGRFAGQRR